MDGNFHIDAAELNRAVDEAEVLSIVFPLIRRSLIIDTRFSTEDEPMVRLAPQTSSMEERYRSIRRMRPNFPRPDNVTAVPWPKYVHSLIQTGVVAHIHRRLEESGFLRPSQALEQALEELSRLEKQELAAAIQGERYHTVWPSRR